MRIRYKIHSIFVLILCLLFILPVVFAQNNDGLKSEVYSKLKCCACREPFDKCTCPEAKEMKAYIDALLESGMSKEEVFYKVAKKFSLKTIQEEQLRQNIEKRLIQEAGQKRPQVILEPTSFDFGSVNKKQGKISKKFKLSNKGNSPLIIKNVKTSCPCATVSLKVNKKKAPYFGTEGAPKNWQIGIKPGGSGELELMIDLSSEHVKSGKLMREAFVFSNDPIYPEVTAKVEAEVNE
ncbi:MAG: DUF1573 domain-containing protein [Nitrospirota bacterium]